MQRSSKDLVRSRAQAPQRTVISQSVRRSGILRRILLFHVTNQLFSGVKLDSKQTAESDWERKMFSRQYLE
jgi:hypothetical protein